jgi:hypothetical protein
MPGGARTLPSLRNDVLDLLWPLGWAERLFHLLCLRGNRRNARCRRAGQIGSGTATNATFLVRLCLRQAVVLNWMIEEKGIGRLRCCIE